MAVTSIWPIKGRVKAVIDYANDPGKVKASSLSEQAALHSVSGVLDYAADGAYAGFVCNDGKSVLYHLKPRVRGRPI